MTLECFGVELGLTDLWQIISPFESVLTHPHLLSHVRSIGVYARWQLASTLTFTGSPAPPDIRAVPTTRAGLLHPTFMAHSARALASCPNLRAFTCTLPNVLPPFLPLLARPRPHHRISLRHLRINGALTTPQVQLLVRVTALESLTLDAGTWNVVDALPGWMVRLAGTLVSLTLYVRVTHVLSLTRSVADDLDREAIAEIRPLGGGWRAHSEYLRIAANAPS